MEHSLNCNAISCRKPVGDRAVVTSCSHIFCLDCANSVNLPGHDPHTRSECPACKAHLPHPDDAVISNLVPGEEYKSIVLCGLSPNVIMECAGRALSFWAYQTTHEIYWQQCLNSKLANRFTKLNMEYTKSMNEAKAQVETLQNQISDLLHEHELLKKKGEDYLQAYKDKSRKLQQIHNLYEKVKRRAEEGPLQQAASDAVDSSILALPQPNVLGLHTKQSNYGSSRNFDQAGHLGLANRSTYIPQTRLNHLGVDGGWSQAGQLRCD
ncbi:hypothetical protein B0I35DRAFT_2539 [Stachybotrys elegans]|uniref:RING-type domain-containing protein n=1 Tax=Stachybotrys elegans TaxID=80388 RepID=A0A8K0T5N1_9HYPO|nr:hypothetical protein B0I35DRAFT_2539 [Stachybotrys elegans]